MGMALASLNINGLRSHLDEVQLPKELTEIPGYQQERRYRTGNGGGVSIYIKDPIKYKLRSDVPTDDLEIICCEIIHQKANPF